MVDSFSFKSVHGGTTLEFRGQIPRALEGYNGTTFVAALAGGPVSAAVTVYDIQPQNWSALFEDLSRHWRGWDGAKTHESLEGHLQVTCTRDRAGHITVRVRLRGDMSEANWSVEDSIFLEAGQLETIAAAARAYFG